MIFVTDLNDYHHIINTILQTRLDKSEPKERIYRNSKIVDTELYWKADICNRIYGVTAHSIFENNLLIFIVNKKSMTT